MSKAESGTVSSLLFKDRSITDTSSSHRSADSRPPQSLQSDAATFAYTACSVTLKVLNLIKYDNNRMTLFYLSIITKKFPEKTKIDECILLK